LEEQHSESFKVLQTQFEQILALKDKELTEARDRVQALSTASHQASADVKSDADYQRHIEGYEVRTSFQSIWSLGQKSSVANEKC
jgi:hypothetical protein